MAISERDNLLRTYGFENPQWIPCRVHVSQASRLEYGLEFHRIAKKYPELFPVNDQRPEAFTDITLAPAHRAGERFRDAWGCVWESPMDGIEGVVTEHPLRDWNDFDHYVFPDPSTEADRGPMNWQAAEEHIKRQQQAGQPTGGGLAHGFLLLRLTYLRGFENVIYDMVDEEPRLAALIEGIYEHSRWLVEKWLSLDVDIVEFPEDLGTQTSSLISPELMDRYILPVYQRLMAPCLQRGKHVGFHSDGYILGIVDRLLAAGVTVINPQDLCNGIDNLAEALKGRVAIRLDIDRQSVIPYGSRADILALIEEEVRKLGSPAGGLEMISGIYPPTSPENVEYLCEALAKYRTYYW